MDLPVGLASALDEVVPAVPSRTLSNAARSLTERYRAGVGPGGGTFIQTDDDVLAYAAYRMPATYASVRRALDAASRALHNFEPHSLLDVGSGPGTATWAAIEAFPTLKQAVLVENDARMIAFGRRLQSRFMSVPDHEWVQSDVTEMPEFPQSDLVIVSYALGELTPESRSAVVGKLWSAARGVLLVVEPGTPSGYNVVLKTRDRLIEMGAHVAAPCPHDRSCPMAGHDWCHFAARLARHPVHRRIKAGTLPYEDEKYSYVALTRDGGLDRTSRVVRHPQIRAGLIRLELCTDNGLQTETVTRSRREEFRIARHIEWGDAWQRKR